jgi:hypothetical protein
MDDPRLGRIFAGPRKATVLATIFYLNYHFIEVQIQINTLPSLIFFVR